MHWFLLVLQSTISAAGVIVLKAFLPNKGISGLNAANVWGVVLGGFLYGISFLIWLYILSKMPVTFAFPVTIGLSLLLTTLAGLLFFGEKLNVYSVSGLILLPVAIFLISVRSLP